MTKIVIVLEGGLVQHVFSESKDSRVLVCDYDTDEGDENDLMEAPAGDTGFHHEREPEVEAGLVDAWFSRWDKACMENDTVGKGGPVTCAYCEGTRYVDKEGNSVSGVIPCPQCNREGGPK